jgi:processive 1,2-diacylglycerol beta-glucosyltransferase
MESTREGESLTELHRVLFISGSLGKGHDVVAEACASALEPFAVQSRIVDSMRLLGKGSSAAGEWVFRKLLSVTAVYDAFHFSQLRDGGRIGHAAERAAIDRMYDPLRAELDSFAPELVVPVFATGAGAIARIKTTHAATPGGRDWSDLASVVIMTDSFAHQMWVHEQTSMFLVTSKAAAESVRRYWPEAPVEVVTAPVRPEFAQAPSQRQARAGLGIPDDAICVLLMSGAWGLGPLDEAATALAVDGIYVLAVAGTNRRMEARLRALVPTHPEIIPFGYTDRVSELMSACDVVVTSSGDTCREARTLGRGLILIDVVPGHGRENLMHELELGGSTACLPTAGSIARAVRSFVDDPERSKVAPAVETGVPEAQFVAALRRMGFTLSNPEAA